MFVYLITNLVNGKVYVGKTIQPISRRFNDHVSEAYRGSTRALCAALRKYGKENFSIIALGSYTSMEDLNAAEVAFITSFNSMQKDTGYNMTPGGEGDIFSGNPHSESIKEKLRGKVMTQEARAHLSKIKKGVKRGPMTADQKMKISVTMLRSGHQPPKYTGVHPMLGKNHTDAARAKMSASRKGRPPSQGALDSIRTRMTNKENWPSYIDITEEELKTCMVNGDSLSTISHKFSASPETIRNKVKKYWGVSFLKAVRVVSITS